MLLIAQTIDFMPTFFLLLPSFSPIILGCDRALKDSQGEKISQSGVSPTEDVWVN
jgi:hypothetical protein